MSLLDNENVIKLQILQNAILEDFQAPHLILEGGKTLKRAFSMIQVKLKQLNNAAQY